MDNESGSRSANSAEIAAKAVRIAKAAATGGPYGAAAEATRQYLPKLLKVVSVILILVLLLPVILFASIPHYLFGWLGNENEDVKNMTELAIDISGVYDRFDDIIKRTTDSVIQILSAPFKNILPIEINTDDGNTGLNWFIAIIAVHYEQDLNVISESAIAKMASDKLRHSISVGLTLIKIEVWDILPDALMKLLGFSEEQRNWAELLVTSMTEEQDNEDYTEGTDYGDITFTEGETDVTYFNQTDSRWSDLPYGKTGTIGRSGCGPTALAIVVSSLSGKTVTPPEIADWAERNGYYVEGKGSRHTLIPDGARHYGLSAEGIGRDGQKVADALADGKLVIAVMSKGHFTSQGHFIVLCGVKEDGKILVADPASVSRSNQLWDLSLILEEANKGADAKGPFWVIW